MNARRSDSLALRLAWLAAFWIGGVGSLGLFAGLLRLFMRGAGLLP